MKYKRIKNLINIFTILLFTSCVNKPEPVIISLGPDYERPGKLTDSDFGYYELSAIVEVDQKSFEKAKADGTAKFIQVINGITYYCVETGFEVDFPKDGITEWVSVLDRFKVKKKAE